MKPLPAPPVSGNTEFERFDNAVRQVLTVSKEEVLKREKSEQQIREHHREDRHKKKQVKQVIKELDGE